MNSFVKPLLTLTVAWLAVGAVPSDAAAKCLERAGSPVLPGYVLIIDGERVGEFAMGQEAEYPPSEQVLRVDVTCLRATEAANRRARQAAVVIVTRQGAPQLLSTYLGDLVAAQAEHHADTGQYAPDLATLDFFASHITVPIEMEVGDDGWWAVAAIFGGNASCRVAVGSFARDPDVQRGRRAAPGTPVCSRG